MENKKETGLLLMLKSGFINKFSLTLCFFVIWISFIDNHNLMVRFRLSNIIKELESEKAKYEKLYIAAKHEKRLLDQNKEKFAREMYLMHKDNEEIFIINKPKK